MKDNLADRSIFHREYDRQQDTQYQRYLKDESLKISILTKSEVNIESNNHISSSLLYQRLKQKNKHLNQYFKSHPKLHVVSKGQFIIDKQKQQRKDLKVNHIYDQKYKKILQYETNTPHDRLSKCFQAQQLLRQNLQRIKSSQQQIFYNQLQRPIQIPNIPSILIENKNTQIINSQAQIQFNTNKMIIYNQQQSFHHITFLDRNNFKFKEQIKKYSNFYKNETKIKIKQIIDQRNEIKQIHQQIIRLLNISSLPQQHKNMNLAHPCLYSVILNTLFKIQSQLYRKQISYHQYILINKRNQYKIYHNNPNQRKRYIQTKIYNESNCRKWIQTLMIFLMTQQIDTEKYYQLAHCLVEYVLMVQLMSRYFQQKNTSNFQVQQLPENQRNFYQQILLCLLKKNYQRINEYQNKLTDVQLQLIEMIKLNNIKWYQKSQQFKKFKQNQFIKAQAQLLLLKNNNHKDIQDFNIIIQLLLLGLIDQVYEYIKSNFLLSHYQKIFLISFFIKNHRILEISSHDMTYWINQLFQACGNTIIQNQDLKQQDQDIECMVYMGFNICNHFLSYPNYQQKFINIFSQNQDLLHKCLQNNNDHQIFNLIQKTNLDINFFNKIFTVYFQKFSNYDQFIKSSISFTFPCLKVINRKMFQNYGIKCNKHQQQKQKCNYFKSLNLRQYLHNSFDFGKDGQDLQKRINNFLLMNSLKLICLYFIDVNTFRITDNIIHNSAQQNIYTYIVHQIELFQKNNKITVNSTGQKICQTYGQKQFNYKLQTLRQATFNSFDIDLVQQIYKLVELAKFLKELIQLKLHNVLQINLRQNSMPFHKYTMDNYYINDYKDFQKIINRIYQNFKQLQQFKPNCAYNILMETLFNFSPCLKNLQIVNDKRFEIKGLKKLGQVIIKILLQRNQSSQHFKRFITECKYIFQIK